MVYLFIFFWILCFLIEPNWKQKIVKRVLGHLFRSSFQMFILFQPLLGPSSSWNPPLFFYVDGVVSVTEYCLFVTSVTGSYGKGGRTRTSCSWGLHCIGQDPGTLSDVKVKHKCGCYWNSMLDLLMSKLWVEISAATIMIFHTYTCIILGPMKLIVTLFDKPESDY